MDLSRGSAFGPAENSARLAHGAPVVVGNVRSLSGSVMLVRAGGESVRVVVGSPLSPGDRIETGPDGRVGIAFDDGTAFNLAGATAITLAEFEFGPDRVLRSARVSVAQGRFAYAAGTTATRGGLSIDTPFAIVRSHARGGAIGTLTLVGFTIALLQNLEAAGNDPFLLDDLITYKDLEHGTLLIAPKGGATRGVVLDDPEVSVIVGPPESGYLVQQVVNSAAEMAVLLAASEDVNFTYLLGEADPFTTGSLQRAETHLFFPDLPIIQLASVSTPLLPPLADTPNNGSGAPEPTGSGNAPPPAQNGLTLDFAIGDDRVLSHDDTPGAQDDTPDNSPKPGNSSDDTSEDFPIELAGIDGLDAAGVIGRARDGSAADPFVNLPRNVSSAANILVTVEASAAGVASGLEVTGGDPIFLFTETTDDGDQVVVGREGSGGTADSDGDIAFVIYVTGDGQALWLQQSLPIDHGDDGNDFDSTLSIADTALLVRVTATDGAASVSQTLPVGDHVVFEDDGPVALNDSVAVQAESKLATVNALIILDTSGSMGSDSDANSGISLAKAAILEFAAQPNVLSIRIVPFAGTAETPSVWFDLTTEEGFAALQAFLDPITGSGSTNYEDAIYDAQQSWTAAPNIGDLNNVYFISDGSPNVRSGNGIADGNPGASGSSAGLTSDEKAAWEAFLAEKGIDNAYAVAINSGVNDIDLQEIAYPNTPGETNNVIALNSASDLSATLQATTLTGTVSGNVIDNETASTADDDSFGSDGPGFVKTLRFDSDGDGDVDASDAIGYRFDGTDIYLNDALFDDNAVEVAFETQFGGSFAFNFETGEWDYTAPESFDAQFTERFTYAVVDGDGDETGPASLDVTVMLPPSDPVVLYLESAQHTAAA